MKKITLIIFLLFLSVTQISASSDLNITGTRVSAECKKIATKKEFTYNQWAGPCHIEHGRQQGIDFLKDNNIVQDTLPPCQKPKDVKLGEKLDAKVPDGYKMVEEKILDTDERTYLGYGKKSYDGNVKNKGQVTTHYLY